MPVSSLIIKLAAILLYASLSSFYLQMQWYVTQACEPLLDPSFCKCQTYSLTVLPTFLASMSANKYDIYYLLSTSIIVAVIKHAHTINTGLGEFRK